MNEAIPSTVEAGAPRRRATRLLVLVGLVALAAGSTGAVAGALVRHGDAASLPTPGPSVYVPYGGQPSVSGSGGSAGQGVAQNQTGALSASPARAGDASVAYPYPYPGPGVCTGSTPAQVGGQVITATGTSSIGIAPGGSAYVLYAWVRSQSSDNVSQAVADVQRRVTAVAASLASAGVPRGSIHPSSVNVYASGGKFGGGAPAPVTGQPVATTTVNASASLTAELPDVGAVDKEVTAAVGAGADSVNVATQGPAAGAPSADALSAALAQASDQAHQLAIAAAKAIGSLSLGAVRSVSTQQPTFCGYGVAAPQLVVGVTVAYAIGG